MSLKSISESLKDAHLPLPGQKVGAGANGEEDVFHFVSHGRVEHRLRVARFSGEERANTPYDFEVEAVAPHNIDPLNALEEELIGHAGTIVMGVQGEPSRVVHGVVTGYEVMRAFDQQTVRVRLKLSARISLLKMRTHSRIFQDMTVPAIVDKLLGEWGVPHHLELVGNYAPRTYVTQYHETDYDFLMRILAREGIFFFYRQDVEKDHEEIVLKDDAMYRRVPGKTSTLVVRTGRFELNEGDIVELGVRRQIRPTAARIGNFDFRHPQLPMRSLELHRDAKGVVGDLGSEKLGTYNFNHEAEQEASASADKRDLDATRMLQSLRSDGLVISGTTRSRNVLPGHTFTLEGHPIEGLNRDWVVMTVLHEGQTPEFGGSDSDEVYHNEIEAVPLETPLRLPHDARKRQVHGTQTAIVVGGSEGEVFTDSFGRVKVQFHWDLEGKRDEHASCWMRVSQPWAGPGFGAQFLPRVGTEVLVTFLDGDPDRPLVIGTVYNGTTPHPFGLPQQRHKSGFRSMSTPGGDGANEISFDDDKGNEVLALKAQRNMELEVGNDHNTTVKGNAVVRVEGQLTENVIGTQATTVSGGQTTLVTLHKTTQVLGDVIDAVRGNADKRVSGDDNLRIEGTARADIAAVDSYVRTDATHRVRGHLTGVVGESGAPTSATIHVEGTFAGYASKTTELIAEKGLVLRCGDSAIRIGPSSVEIMSPRITLTGDKLEAGVKESVTVVSDDSIVLKSKRLHAMGESSSLLLFKDADLGGNRVKLNCKVDEAAVVAKSKPLTRIQLSDEDGTPARRRRFVIVDGDGERSGVLDDKGQAVVELDRNAKIYFPDVDKPREA